MPELSLDEARRLLLHGQGLIERSVEPVGAVRRVVAVQTQYAQSLPVGAAARAKQSPKGWIARELAPHGELVKAWTVRHTLHTMTTDQFELLNSALGGQQYARFLSHMEKYFGLDSAEVERRHKAIVDALAEGPLTREEIGARVPHYRKVRSGGWGNETLVWGYDLMGLTLQGRAAICNGSGAARFGLLPPPAGPRSGEHARTELARRYLEAYGAATLVDFRCWSGMYAKPAQAAFEALDSEIETVEVEGRGAMFALRKSLSALSQIEKAPHVRLLSKFDTLVLGHRDRSLYLDPKRESLVSRKAGQIEAVLLVRGTAKGTWRHRCTAKRLTLEIERWPMRWSGALENALEKEARHLAKALGAADVEISIRDV